MTDNLSGQENSADDHSTKENQNRPKEEKRETHHTLLDPTIVKELSRTILDEWKAEKEKEPKHTRFEYTHVGITIVLAALTLSVLVVQCNQGTRMNAHIKSNDSAQADRDRIRDSISDTLAKISHSLIGQYVAATNVAADAAKKSLDASDAPFVTVNPRFTRDRNGKENGMLMVFENTGNSAATDLSFEVHPIYSETPSWPDSAFEFERRDPPHIIPRGKSRRSTGIKFPSHGFWEPVSRGETFIMMVVVGEYGRKLDKRKHQINECHYYNFRDQAWTTCDLPVK